MTNSETGALARELAAATRFHRLVHVPVCESTQDLAQQFDGNAVVWADEQQAGRGRLGRPWHGAPGVDVEVTLRCEGLRLDDPSILAAVVPAAVAEALDRHAREPLRIKWPNDVICGGRKLAGVLIDAAGNPPSSFLIGVGINTNRTTFPPELLETATSLALAGGRAVDRGTVLFDVAVALDRALAEVEAGATERLARSFADRLGLVGKTVKVTETARELEGELTAIDLQEAVLDGETVVRLALVRHLGMAR